MAQGQKVKKYGVASAALSAALALVVLASLLFPVGAVNIGTGAALAPDPDGTARSVYLGSADGVPIQWRIVASTIGDGSLALLAQTPVAASAAYDGGGNADWDGSDICAWLNGSFLSSAFSAAERAQLAPYSAAVSQTVALPAASDVGDGGHFGMTAGGRAFGAEWWLRADGVNPALVVQQDNGDEDENGPLAPDDEPGPQAGMAPFVGADGTVDEDGADVTQGRAIHPVLRLGLGYVLFASDASGGATKAAEVVGQAIAAADPPTDAMKLTILDNAQRAEIVATTSQATQSGVGTVQFAYRGATPGANQYISCVLTANGVVEYYGKLADSSAAASGALDLPLVGVADGSYILQIFSEQANGDFVSDYCSAPATATLTVSGGLGTIADFDGTVEDTAPVISSITPENGASGTPTSGNIQLVFNETMSQLPGVVTLEGGEGPVATTGGTWKGGNTYVVGYAGLAGDTSYTVEVSGFADAQGSYMDDDANNSFTTAQQVTVDGVQADKASLSADGGGVNVTVSGQNLPEGVTVTAFDGDTPTSITGRTAGSGASGAVQLVFPANASSGEKKYTIRASLNGGQSYEKPAAKVAVAASSSITGVSADPGALPAAGGNVAVIVKGKNLPEGILLVAFDGETPTDIRATTAGKGNKGTASLAFPANNTSAEKTYTLRASVDGGASYSGFTATVRVAPSAGITGVAANPASLPQGGGTTAVTVSGQGLPEGILVRAYVGDMATDISGKTTGSGSSGTVQLTFPANTSTADMVYTVWASVDGGTSWNGNTATVTVKSGYAISGIAAAPNLLPSAGGGTVVKVTGQNMPAGLVVTAFDGANPTAVSAVTANAGNEVAVSLNFPANPDTAADKHYGVRVSADGGKTYSAISAGVVVSRAGVPNPVAYTAQANLTYDGKGDVTFTVSAPAASKGVSLTVNGQAVSGGDRSFGSGTVTIKKAYLDMLKDGLYNVDVQYSDGYAHTTLRVQRASSSSSSSSGSSSSSSSSSRSSSSGSSSSGSSSLSSSSSAQSASSASATSASSGSEDKGGSPVLVIVAIVLVLVLGGVITALVLIRRRNRFN